jgi:hypothetical protein
MNKVTDVVNNYLIGQLARQVEDNGLVVWYDPTGVYAEVADALELPNTTVLRYTDSFLQLRWEIDQRQLMDGEQPPRLVVYVPLAQEETHRALAELEAAGVVMQPGQQPPARNTRLGVIARNALKSILGDETAAEVEKQAEAGKLSLADLNALAEKGGAISQGILSLVFGTANPQEVGLVFLASDSHDTEIGKRKAEGELADMLRHAYACEIAADDSLEAMRTRLSRHVLVTDLLAGLGEAAPEALKTATVAPTAASRDACVELARTWRLRRDTRDSYVIAANKVEQELALPSTNLPAEAIAGIETFAAIEQALLQHVESRLLETTDGDMLTLASSRLARFWCDVEPRFQARWALVASAAKVLLEADCVQKAMQTAPATFVGFLNEYAQSPQPWCVLDTQHRHMESLWYSFEPQVGDDHERIEKLIIKARRRYVEVGSVLAREFISRLHRDGTPTGNVLHQRQIFQGRVKPLLGKEKVAYMWVDALRFEMARELERLLQADFAVELEAALAAAPTITEIGMATLLPGADVSAKVVSAGSSGKLALDVDGVVVKSRKDRVTLLTQRAGVSVFETKLDNLLPKPSKKTQEGIATTELILVTSQEIDELCEQDNITQARRQLDGVLNDLRRGIRVLAEAGVQRIILTSDHGHLFADELSEDMKVDAPGGNTVDLHRRVWIGNGGTLNDACVRGPLSVFGMDGEYDLASPWTFACFKVQGGASAYFHGGLSPQELVIPVMTLKPVVSATAASLPGIDWQLAPGSPKLSTRFFSVQIGGTNPGLFEFTPPAVRVELRSKGKTLSRAVSASYGFDEATGDVKLRNDESNPKALAPNTVTLMLLEVPEQKTVSLSLLDAATGVELARLDKIEVAISL